MNNAIDEKGVFTAAHRNFDDNTVFRIVVDSIARGDDTLVCDDLGDEWADFIGIDSTKDPKTISFYHAKHDEVSLSAGPLQVVVAQAIKNLGRTNLSANDIQRKMEKWTDPYRNNSAETLIQRIVRSDPRTLIQRITDVLSFPDTIRRVYLVVTSLSRERLSTTFAEIAVGRAPTVHFVQLYWLLMSYFSACTEVGAYPYVVCRE